MGRERQGGGLNATVNSRCACRAELQPGGPQCTQIPGSRGPHSPCIVFSAFNCPRKAAGTRREAPSGRLRDGQLSPRPHSLKHRPR